MGRASQARGRRKVAVNYVAEELRDWD